MKNSQVNKKYFSPIFLVYLLAIIFSSCVSDKNSADLKDAALPPLKRDAAGACLVEDVEGEYHSVGTSCREGKKPSKVNYDIAPDKYVVRKSKNGLGIIELHFKKPQSKREAFSLAFPNAAPAVSLQDTGIQCDNTKSGDLRLFQVLNCGVKTKCSYSFTKKDGKFLGAANVFQETGNSSCTISLKKIN